MKITNQWLSEHNACTEGLDWWQSQKENDSIKVLRKLMKLKKWGWFRWLAPRLMAHAQKVEWSIFCAEQVLHIYEKKYPKNLAPRKAIEAAKKWIENPCEETRNTAAAAYAADAAAYAATAAAAYAANAAAYAADAAAYAAANAADAAAYAADAADAAAYAAANADYAAANADYAAAYAAAAAREKMRKICAEKAIEILKWKGQIK